MPTIPSIEEIEEYLLSLVARDRGVTISVLREEAERCPFDPPWNSEYFVHLQPEIEEYFKVEFDPIKVEEVQRSLALLARYIQDLVRVSQAESA